MEPAFVLLTVHQHGWDLTQQSLRPSSRYSRIAVVSDGQR
jgi:hypothetical protein